MPLLDLTAELMGDPAASFRRAPTEQEMNRARYNGATIETKLLEKYTRKPGDVQSSHPYSKVLNLPVGGFLIKDSKLLATSALKTLRNYGLNGVANKMECGRYQVVRTA